MFTASGLSVFLGTNTRLATISGEFYGRLYGGAGGTYVYQTASTYKITSSGVSIVYTGRANSLTNIYDTLDRTLLSIPSYPRQRFLQQTVPEHPNHWTLCQAMPSGVSSDLLSDDGDRINVVPVLTGNEVNIGHRVDRIIAFTTALKSDTGLPQSDGDWAYITDLEAAI